MKLTDKITITNEDNMELMARYPDNYFDLAIVDPPYGLGDSVVNSGGRFKRYENKNGNWDKEIPKENYFKELFRVSKEQIIWGGNYFPLPPNKCFIVWDKKQPEGISFAMAEYAWVSFNKVAQIYSERTQGQKERFHPTQKPRQLYNWLLDNYAKEGDKILDTHGGSMSIALAVHDKNEIDGMNLSLTMCELDEDYYNAGIRRVKEYISQIKMNF